MRLLIFPQALATLAAAPASKSHNISQGTWAKAVVCGIPLSSASDSSFGNSHWADCQKVLVLLCGSFYIAADELNMKTLRELSRITPGLS